VYTGDLVLPGAGESEDIGLKKKAKNYAEVTEGAEFAEKRRGRKRDGNTPTGSPRCSGRSGAGAGHRDRNTEGTEVRGREEE
jgi:hypothetical protein